eukprot:TRINITY_DN25787_c0_g1_i1.p1 TRINITY_DN25787_c0_g1~~TRINITY_DN25787_c0_g1_i1.p1  ORF type:complete len:540 (-),score=72.77 TRINITY_DN25787_c0_g1_i1:230-1849(-)
MSRLTSACFLSFGFMCIAFAPAASATVASRTCEPIYPECVCNTKSLNCSTVYEIRKEIAKKVWGYRVPGTTQSELTASAEALKANPAHLSLTAADYVGGVVRLIWHDAAEYDPASSDGLGPDGCVNLGADSSADSKAKHAGLAAVIADLDLVWRPFCGTISRADFWVLAAKTVIEESTSYVASEFGRNVNAVDGGMHGTPAPSGGRRLLKGDEVLENYILPFRYGRSDKKSCVVAAGKQRLPSAEKTNQIETYVMNKFNLTTRQTVALMGAHTLGRCDMNNSGYNSTWKDRGDLFTTAYFKLLIEGRWKRAEMSNPHHPAERMFQWNHVTKSDREQWAMMLASDMQLVYDIDPEKRATEPYAAECGPVDKESAKKDPSLQCPLLSSKPSRAAFDLIVKEFAEGATATHDEPGASKWLISFAEAFKKMTEAGYAETDLQCPPCPPSICPYCPQNVLCRCAGALYYTQGQLDMTNSSKCSSNSSTTKTTVPSASGATSTTTGTPGTGTSSGVNSMSHAAESEGTRLLWVLCLWCLFSFSGI